MSKLKQQPQTAPTNAQAGWRPAPWRKAVDISNSHLHALWARGCGPQRVRLGRAVVIVESPQEYLRRIAAEQNAA